MRIKNLHVNFIISFDKIKYPQKKGTANLITVKILNIFPLRLGKTRVPTISPPTACTGNVSQVSVAY